MVKEFFIDLETDYKERWTAAKFMEFVGDNYDPLTSHVIDAIRELKPKGKIQISGNDYRPDNLSYSLYGDTQFWWVLMMYNGYMSIDDIKTGNEISYPDISDLEDLYFSLKIKQGNNS